MEWTGWQTKLLVQRAKPEAEEAADVLVVAVDAESLKSNAAIVNAAVDKALRDLYDRGIFGAKLGETTVLPTLGTAAASYIVAVGVEPSPGSLRGIRLAAGGVGRALAKLKANTVRWRVPPEWETKTPAFHPAEAAAATAEGLLLGLYRRRTYSSASAEGARQRPLASFCFIVTNEQAARDWEAGLADGLVSADAVCYARELANMPGNMLTPDRLAKEAKALAAAYGLELIVYDEREAASEGMGGLLAVGQGSVHPPRMIVIRYSGDPQSKETLGLIGKGITFDTGGISLKKPEGMEEMISDMGGAATVFGVMRAVAELKPALNVVAVIPAAENMPSGNAFKPGDVIRTYSGKTVEVLNTDAEGRIVLADGLTAAIRAGATRLIDVATLTGAVMVAFGDITTGAIGNDEPLMESVLLASRKAGEYVWPLPAHPEYRTALDSDVADLKNMGGKWGGAIYGGLFVGAFAEELPWVHLDIGGTAWMWSDRELEAAGGTGVMVRTLLAFACGEARR